MAKSYNRRINLYINGKEVKNDISSIRKEMYKLINQQARMTRGSDEYISHTKKIRALRSILDQHNQQLRQTGNSWMSLKKMANGFNNYFGLVTAFLASFTGVVLGFRKAADAANLFEERLDNLSALTGLTGKELQWLGDNAKASSTKITENGIRIKQAATDIVDAYTKVGSQRPELLKNKEALAAVTEDAILLSEAAKTKLDPAVSALTTSLNQFNDPASQSRRHINAIAAGSKFGAANVPYLTQALEKMGTTFALMGGQVEGAVGLIEAVAPKFSKAEIAGNSLDKVLLKLKNRGIGYKDGVFDINRALDELAARYKKGESASSIFGDEHAKMAEVLVAARGDVKAYTKAVTDTNVAIEQAGINTDNNSAKLAQARNDLALLTMEFGEKLAPAMVVSTNGMTYFIKALMAAPKFIKENQVLLIAIAGALLTYNSLLIKSIALSIKERAVRLAMLAADKSYIVVANAKAILARTQIALTGQATMAQKRAIVTQRSMNAAMMANPIGIIIAALFALVVAIKSYDKYSAKSVRLEKDKKKAIDDLEEANGALNQSYSELKKGIGNVNRLSVQEKKDLKEKFDKTIQLAEAELALHKAKQKQILADNTRASLWQMTWNYIKSAGNSTNFTLENVNDALKNGKDAAGEMNPELDKLTQKLATLKRESSDLNNILNAEKIGDSIGTETLIQMEEKMNHYQVALKNAAAGGEDYLRVQEKIKKLNEQMAKAQNVNVSTEEEKKRLKQLAKEKEKIEQKLADKTKEIRNQLKISEVDKDAKELAEMEVKYEELYALAKKYNLDTTELEKLHDEEKKHLEEKREKKRLKAKQKVEQKIQETVANSGDKEVLEITKKYKELIKLAEKYGIDTVELYEKMEEEISKSNKEHRDVLGMNEEDWEKFQENMEMAIQFAEQLGSVWGSINKIRANQEQKEFNRFEKETKKKKALLDDQLEHGEISQEQYNAKVSKLDTELDEKRAEMARKQAKRDKALRIFEATTSTAAAIIHMLADPGGFAGVALSVMAGITGAAQIAAIASEPLPEFAVGGFTNGARAYIAGEAGTEWIASNSMVNDPTTGPVINQLEMIRKGLAPKSSIVTPLNPDFQSMTSMPMFSNGGFTGSQTSNNYYSSSSKDERIDEMIALMTEQSEQTRLLTMYLSDPENRKASINYDLMKKANQEMEELRKVGALG